MPVLYKDILGLECGAQFLNVDLHIHSYGASKDVKDPKMTPQAIVESAVSQGLQVIAITDHNSDRNVAEALELARKHADKLLVLPGVEITTANGHLLAYFPPEQAGELSRFLAKLDLKGEMGDEGTHTAKSMADVITEAEKLGGVCIAAHIDRPKTGFEALMNGYPNWKKDVICSPGLYGVECDEIDHLGWYSDADDAGSAGAERTKLLEQREATRGMSGRKRLAHVQGSDAHSLEAFQTPNPDKPWTHIKMTELSFAAFRTALIDPTARVVPKASVPRSIPRVRGMAVVGGFVDGEMIRFSDNLNCFIGGRGTGKSTAVRSLAYCLGADEDFGAFETCPESIVVFCEDADGVVYRYERSRGGDISVKAREDGSIADVPTDSFRIEYFGQGELARVAEDPLRNPKLFQGFLDRHIRLSDLEANATTLLAQLRTNSARLEPMENRYGQLGDKKKSLTEIEAKLKVAEEGKLSEIVAVQSRIASERSIKSTLDGIITKYNAGVTLASLSNDFTKIAAAAGGTTDDAAAMDVLAKVKDRLDATNAALATKASEINAILKASATDLASKCGELKGHHARIEAGLAAQIAELKKKGLAGNLAELELLLKQKTAIAKDVAEIELTEKELKECRKERQSLLSQLRANRLEMTQRRKSQLDGINRNLASTIKEYKVFVKYDDAGITDVFQDFIVNRMRGSYFPEESARQLCDRIAPQQLAECVLRRDLSKLGTITGLSKPWIERLVDKLCYWNVLFELDLLEKPPKPVITVLTKSVPPKALAVAQLSDGQRHTILLTIALLAESNVPLVIDQPEDDLDNAFIFSSIVTTLRTIKERRQVLLITHNANIAVLGDSELLLPMRRENDCGKAVERGSIDRAATKNQAQQILEGGPEAFRRRWEMYGH